MNITETTLRDAFTIDPVIHGDERGNFYEGFNCKRILDATGYEFNVAQTNHSRSTKHILRGLHYQIENIQAKLVWATAGEIHDVIVDLRRSSPNFGQWQGFTLSADNRQRLLVPEGFAHGFLVLSETAEITYLTSDIYNPAAERLLRWNCPEIGIEWPIEAPTLNDRDASAPRFGDCETYP
jgi:dTDP-4-dehydrorhamnose 3,5-epimerase